MDWGVRLENAVTLMREVPDELVIRDESGREVQAIRRPEPIPPLKRGQTAWMRWSDGRSIAKPRYIRGGGPKSVDHFHEA